jgi:hypothetical protein
MTRLHSAGELSYKMHVVPYFSFLCATSVSFVSLWWRNIKQKLTTETLRTQRSHGDFQKGHYQNAN